MLTAIIAGLSGTTILGVWIPIIVAIRKPANSN